MMSVMSEPAKVLVSRLASIGGPSVDLMSSFRDDMSPILMSPVLMEKTRTEDGYDAFRMSLRADENYDSIRRICTDFRDDMSPMLNMTRLMTEDGFNDSRMSRYESIRKINTDDGFDRDVHHPAFFTGLRSGLSLTNIKEPPQQPPLPQPHQPQLPQLPVQSKPTSSQLPVVPGMVPQQAEASPSKAARAAKNKKKKVSPPGNFEGGGFSPTAAVQAAFAASMGLPGFPLMPGMPGMLGMPYPMWPLGMPFPGMPGMPTPQQVQQAQQAQQQQAGWQRERAGRLDRRAEEQAWAAQSPGAGSVAGRVWTLAQDASGSREVQASLDTAKNDAERVALASELKGHIWEALHGPFAKHANHVVQKATLTVGPAALQFVVDEIAEGGFAAAAKNKYGSRIMKRLLDRCNREQTRALVEAILDDAIAVSQSPHGFLVMQHLLKRALPEPRRRLFGLLQGSIRSLSSDSSSCAVVNAALSETGCVGEQVELARAMLREPGLLVFLACTQQGHQAVRRVLELLSGDDLQEARRQLDSEAAALGASRYGRQVMTAVDSGAASPVTSDASPLRGENASLHGSVWALSRDAACCRDVQRALETASSEDERASLAKELHGHVWESLRCPHANHVIQKLVETAHPTTVRFVVEELMQGDVVEAAQHKYGSRIAQRVVQLSSIPQVSELIEKLLARWQDLARHAYGNYVIQDVLEHGNGDQRHRLILAMESDLCDLITDTYGCAVASACICFGAQSDKARLVGMFLNRPGLLRDMSGTRHGHVAVKRILGALQGEPLDMARRALAADRAALSSSRYGRSVLASLEANEAGTTASLVAQCA